MSPNDDCGFLKGVPVRTANASSFLCDTQCGARILKLGSCARRCCRDDDDDDDDDGDAAVVDDVGDDGDDDDHDIATDV